MNEAYLKLARRRGLINNHVAHLVKEHTSAYGAAPREVITIDDVPRSVSEIPQEDVQDYINELQQEEERIRLEMNRFEFVRKEDEQRKPTGTNGNGVAAETAGPGEGKAGGHRRRRRR